MSLHAYEKKRDFSKTPEPGSRKRARRKADLQFVIQKHDASRLHYDFRLEMDGALVSWAVPKGIPYRRGDKHLAVHVEDHPLSYASFEGVIPEDQYGGGTVMVWDTGTWKPLGKRDPKKDLQNGKLHFALHGKKLNGEWALVRKRDDDDWLLIKSGEDMPPVSKTADGKSVLSGRTLHEIASDRDSHWESNHAIPPAEPRARELQKKKASTQATTTEKRVPAPKYIEPMRAKPVQSPPTGNDWIYELKFDGFRAEAIKNGEEVKLVSRNAKDFTGKFRELVEPLMKIAAQSAVVDGEIVALDEEGRSSFQLLQQYELGQKRPPIFFYAFDLLFLNQKDLRELPLQERKKTLESLLGDAKDPLRYSANIEADPRELLEQVKARGLEGIIGKRRSSRYNSAARTGAWVKLKCVNQQEFVIGGSTLPRGTRKHFGALLVGYYEGLTLKFAGKVGTGFDDTLLRKLHQELEAIARSDCPFANLPEKKQGRWVQNITPREMKNCRWVEPQIVCELKFTEWTIDGKLRHPVFLGIRPDKLAQEVVRES